MAFLCVAVASFMQPIPAGGIVHAYLHFPKNDTRHFDIVSFIRLSTRQCHTPLTLQQFHTAALLEITRLMPRGYYKTITIHFAYVT